MSENQQPFIVPGVTGNRGQRKPALSPCVYESRPTFALEGHEDEVYHERTVPGLENEPEYCAFVGKSWTFNRAMEWIKPEDKTIICAARSGNLPLTGTERVSDWFTGTENRIEHAAHRTRFTKESQRCLDCICLPGLQFHRRQHPRLVITVDVCSAEWQICVLVKGRAGAPLVASDWQSGPAAAELDLDRALAEKGFTNRYPELHIAVGLWSEDHSSAHIHFSAEMPAADAAVGCLPVVRTAQAAQSRDVPLSALICDAQGNIPDPETVTVTAQINSRTVPMTAAGNVWQTSLTDLKPGEYDCVIKSRGAVAAQDTVPIRVVSEDFIRYDANQRSLVSGERPTGPLSGSYQGFAFFADAGTDTERMINGQSEWDAWDRCTQPGEHWHYWEALTETELNQRFSYLNTCGWDVIHLSQGWGVWEKLDVCGHIVPHGAEQIFFVLQAGTRHNIQLLQALSHYPYGEQKTQWAPAYRQYLESGYQESDWDNPDTSFTQLFHNYLKEFALLFAEEPTLLAVTTSGEGDIKAGPDRVNSTHDFLLQELPNHIFAAEPIHRLHELPDTHTQGWKPALSGSRLYWIGDRIAPEIDMAVEIKILALSDVFIGEGSWPCHHLHADFMGFEDTWAATDQYRRRLRDTLYMGLIHRIPLILTWEEQYTEDERIIFNRVRNSIDWSQSFSPCMCSILVDDRNAGGGGDEEKMKFREVLAGYEQLLSGFPADSSYITKDHPADKNRIVFDARALKSFEEIELDVTSICEQLRSSAPFQLNTPDYRSMYLLSTDRSTLAAYLYNCADYQTLDSTKKTPPLTGNIFRSPKPADLEVGFDTPNSVTGNAVLYDLDIKKPVKEFDTAEEPRLTIANTDHDFLLLVKEAVDGR